jgi:hypothetical protein
MVFTDQPTALSVAGSIVDGDVPDELVVEPPGLVVTDPA